MRRLSESALSTAERTLSQWDDGRRNLYRLLDLVCDLGFPLMILIDVENEASAEEASHRRGSQ